MTETNAIHTAIAGEDYVDHPDSVGWVVPVCEVKIVDPETRKELPTGEVGLIYMRGQNVMTCYVDDPEATFKTLDKDGWLDSGDVGCLDAEELLYIRDRSKDLIIRGGENIASLEVENALYLDSRVAEAAAVPVPCPLMGERVGAMVSMAPGCTATPEEIMIQVQPRLRHAARPVIVLVHPEPLREFSCRSCGVADRQRVMPTARLSRRTARRLSASSGRRSSHAPSSNCAVATNLCL